LRSSSVLSAQTVAVQAIEKDNGLSEGFHQAAKQIARVAGEVESERAWRVISGWWTLAHHEG
jgi:hypothetical protein